MENQTTELQEVPRLARKLGLLKLYLKREDKHPYGSQKGRSIPYLIDLYAKEGFEKFAISSSGNAGLASGLYIQEKNKSIEKLISLDIFIGEKIDSAKEKFLREKLTDKNIRIVKTERPKQELIKKTANGDVKSLRQSTDENALVGYFDLASELILVEGLSDIFIGASSGTASEGIATGLFQKHSYISNHIVQTSGCHTLAQAVFPKKVWETEESIAGAIVDNIGHRKERVAKYVKKSKGSAWVVSNKEIREAIEMLSKTEKIKLTTNGVLPIAGLIQAVKEGREFKGAVVCVVGGK